MSEEDQIIAARLMVEQLGFTPARAAQAATTVMAAVVPLSPKQRAEMAQRIEEAISPTTLEHRKPPVSSSGGFHLLQ